MDPLRAPYTTDQEVSDLTVLGHGIRRSNPCEVHDPNWIPGQPIGAQEFVFLSQPVDQSMAIGSSNLTSPPTHPQGQMRCMGCLIRSKTHYRAPCGLSQVIQPRFLNTGTRRRSHNAPARQRVLMIVQQPRPLSQSLWANEICRQMQCQRHPIKLPVNESSSLKNIRFSAPVDQAHHLTPSKGITNNRLLSPDRKTDLQALENAAEPLEQVSRVAELEESSRPCMPTVGRENTQARKTQGHDTRGRASSRSLQSCTSGRLTSDPDQSALSGYELPFVPDSLSEQSANRSPSSVRDTAANCDDEALPEGEMAWADSGDSGAREEEDEYWTWDKEREQWFHFDTETGSTVWCPRSFD